MAAEENPTTFQVGDHVEVQGSHAIVRFIGQTEFSDGDWMGVEFDHPSGKNDGTVNGVVYFNCEPRYGMFVRPRTAQLMERPTRPVPRPQQPTPQPPRAGSRASMAAVTRDKRMSMSGTSPDPGMATGGRGSRSMSLRPPSKPPTSPTKQLGSGPSPSSAGPSTPRTSTPTTRTGTPTLTTKTTLRPPPPTSGSRPGPMAPPPPKAPAKRSSIGGLSRTGSVSSTASGVSARTVAKFITAANRLSLKPGGVGALQRKVSSQSGSERTSPDVAGAVRRTRTDTVSGNTSPRGTSRRDSLAPSTGSRASSSTATSPVRAVAAAQRSGAKNESAELAASQRECEDLRSKIKVLEKKRLEDRDKVKILERVQEEKDKFELIIQKLQAKYQPLSQRNVELEKENKIMIAEMQEMERNVAEHETILEMATLDREMAEEQAEAYKAEWEAARAKAEEYEMERDILQEENDELSKGMSPEEKNSVGWMQLVKQNDRLRDALLQLREITGQTEDELKATIESLEEDNNDLQKYKDEYELTREKLIAADSAIEDLRQQLETALGAEEMLEELTERNMSMGEQIDELRATVEDLESLKEVSDELEINHVETEKQMQEELDYRDLLIVEQSKKIQQLDTSNEEAEYTITRFRDLVINLQSDLEDMRASQQLTETEAKELTERSRSMMDINMKLQITAAKAQNKTIDLELRRLEAEEAMEHLAIVQMFLPESFHIDRDSVLALLRFKRVAFKAHMLQTFVKERVSGQTGHAGDEGSTMAACDVVDKLTWVSAMCDRFVSCFQSCSVGQFSRFQGALYELDPVERALNGWIEGLRRDELKEKQCAAELQRTIALMAHLGEIHLKTDLEGFSSDLHMRSLLMQTYMESTAAAISHIRTMVQNKLPSTAGTEDGEAAANFARKAEAIVSHSRGAKVIVSKILRAIDDFRQRCLSLTLDKSDLFEEVEESAKKMANYTRTVGEAVYALLYEETSTDDDEEDPDTKKTPSWIDLQTVLFRITEKTLMTSESDIFGALSKDLRQLTINLAELGAVASDVDMTTEFEQAPTPWTLRAQELRATKVVSVDTEEQLQRLREGLHHHATTIRMKDKELEEQAVKIELLESRMLNVSKQAQRIEKLELNVADGTAREKDLTEAVENLNEEIQTLEADTAKWKKIAEDKRTVGDSDRAGHERAVATAREVNALKQDITGLRNAVAHFRNENAILRKADVDSPGSWLRQPLLQPAVLSPQEALQVEARDVLAELRKLVVEERVVDLTKMGPDDRLAWRPARQTVRWNLECQRERYETVKAWKEDVMARIEIQQKAEAAKGGDGDRDRWTKAARMQFEGKVDKILWPINANSGRDVEIRDPEAWQGVLEAVGIEAL